MIVPDGLAAADAPHAPEPAQHAQLLEYKAALFSPVNTATSPLNLS
ncbi:hypothetical protein [Streptomyces sp. NPDC090445]